SRAVQNAANVQASQAPARVLSRKTQGSAMHGNPITTRIRHMKSAWTWKTAALTGLSNSDSSDHLSLRLMGQCMTASRKNMAPAIRSKMLSVVVTVQSIRKPGQTASREIPASLHAALLGETIRPFFQR